jgi:hypothetical protein
MDLDAFEKRMKKIRKDTGLNTLQFSTEISSMTNWYGYEKGLCLPTLQSAAIVCKKLKINLEWFTHGTGKKHYK